MSQRLTLYIATLVSVVLYGTNAVSLDCGDIKAAACKIQFETKLDFEMKQLHVDIYRKMINGHIDFWNAVLHDLPENDKHVPMIQETIKNLREYLPKLNEDFNDAQKMANVFYQIPNIMNPDFAQLEYDENAGLESEEDYQTPFDLVKEKNGYEELQYSSAIGVVDKAIIEMDNNWKSLYADLRPTDRITYPNYERLNGIFDNTILNTSAYHRAQYFVKLMTEFRQFFNLPYLKALYPLTLN